jgi:GH25 family lysozyme M1 (1,4-beta-N-acetylmuramidase)
MNRLRSGKARWLPVAAIAALLIGGAPAGTAHAAPQSVDHEHSAQLAAELAHSTPSQRAAAQRFAAEQSSAADPVKGIHVSSHHHPDGAPINWPQVAAGGYRFAGVKATEGTTYTNTEYFTTDLNGARSAGMYAFAYHHAIPNASTGTAQATYFLDRAAYTPDGKTLTPALRIEWNPTGDGTGPCYGRTPTELVTWIREFVDEVTRRTGNPAIIYTAPSWWNTCTSASAAFTANPLWSASISTTPELPTGWTDWTLWHYGIEIVPGIDTPVDANLVNGGEPTLAAMTTDPAGYTPTTPTRVLDTRNAIGVPTTTPLGTQTSVTVDLSTQLPATAAVINVTGIATAATFITVWQANTPRPSASHLNLVAGDTRPNLVTVPVGPDRKIQLYNHFGNTHILADLAGHYATDAPGLHTALTPTRVLNTNTTGPLGAGSVYTLNLTTTLPATATAVTLNITATGASLPTFITAWPTGQTRPNASNLNLNDANPTANLITIPLGTNKSINLYNHAGTVHLLGDLAAHYAPDTGSRYIARPTQRLLDTRPTPPTWTPATGGGSAFTLNLNSHIPPIATAALLNITGITPTTPTFLAATPKTSTTPTRPTTSNLNLTTGQTLSNLTDTTLGTNNDIWIYNSTGTINVITDLTGYFTP